MSRSHHEFLPLIAPEIEPVNALPAAPVNWFQEIAPRLAEIVHPEYDNVGVAPDNRDGKSRKVAFGSIDEIAWREQARRRQGEPEPEEIIRLRAAAEAEARVVLSTAHEQALLIEEESRRRGYQSGYDAGYTCGRDEVTVSLTKRADDERTAYREDLEAFVEHIEAERKTAWAEMEPEMIGLVFEIAKKVIKTEVEASREVSLAVVQNALRRVAETGTIRIRVHADDLETIRANREDLLTLVDGIRHIEIISDRRIGLGGCIVETDAGTIDARIETQVDEVEKMLEQAVQHRDGQN